MQHCYTTSGLCLPVSGNAEFFSKVIPTLLEDVTAKYRSYVDLVMVLLLERVMKVVLSQLSLLT